METIKSILCGLLFPSFKVKNISTNQAECLKFGSEYKLKSNGGEASLAYLQKAQTYVFYKAQTPEKWLGGFAINIESGFRYLSGFSDKQHYDLLASYNLNPLDIAEIGCMYLHSKSISFKQRFFVYAFIIYQVIKTGKQVVMAGSFIPKLQQLHMKVLPNLLYEGKAMVAGKEAVAKFYFGYKNEIVKNFFEGLLYDTEKVLIKKWHK